MFDGITPAGILLISVLGGSILMFLPAIGDVVRRMNRNQRRKNREDEQR